VSSFIELFMWDSYGDGECSYCREMYEITAFAAYDDTAGVCPACAERLSPGMQDIIRGLDAVHEGVVWDVFTRPITAADAHTITRALRHLADRIDDVMADRVQVRLCTRVEEGFPPNEAGVPIGVSISRQIVHTTTKGAS